MLRKNSFFALLLLLAAALPAQPDTLRLIFAGDIMGHAPQIKSAETAPGKYDYTPCFRYIKPVLSKADLAIGNLELTLPGKGPYSGYPMFRSPDALAWDGRDKTGHIVPAGVYIYKIEGEGRTFTGTVVVAQ